MKAAKAYREAAVLGATPIGLVVILFETLLDGLQQACTAIDAGNIEERVKELNHALAVVGELQSSLNMEQGGDFAARMNRYYEMTRARIMDANISVSIPNLQKLMSELHVLRDAWSSVDRPGPQISEAAPPQPARSTISEDGNASSSWTA